MLFNRRTKHFGKVKSDKKKKQAELKSDKQSI